MASVSATVSSTRHAMKPDGHGEGADLAFGQVTLAQGRAMKASISAAGQRARRPAFAG